LGLNDAWKDYAEPVDISACFEDSQIVQISAGSQHCVALTATGTVYSWGNNHSGQVRDLSFRLLSPHLSVFAIF